MIRLHVLKILQTVLVTSFLFFVQGEVLVVYAGGVSTGFQNYLNTLSGILSGNISASDLSATTTSSASTSASSLAAAASQNNTSSAQVSFISYYNPPEHTTELLYPINFNPLPENESLLPMAESYAVTICLSHNGKMASGCIDENTPFQASEKLAIIIINKYLKGTDVRPFRVVMPSSMPSDQRLQILRQIETGAINIIGSRMLSNENKEKRNIFIEGIKAAKQEAENDSNWSHDLKDDGLICNFHIGNALSEINNILISGRQFK